MSLHNSTLPQVRKLGTAVETGAFNSEDAALADGKYALFAASIPITGWTLLTMVHKGDLLASVKETEKDINSATHELNMKLAAVSLVFLTLAVAFILFYFNKRVFRPINTLADAMQRFSKGDRDTRITAIDTKDEFSLLATEYNTLADSIQTQQEELGRAEAKFRGIFENALEGIFQLDEHGTLLNANPSCAALFGFTVFDDMASEFNDIRTRFFQHPEDCDRLVEQVKNNGKASGLEIEFRRPHDGESFWGLLSIRRRISNETGSRIYDGNILDITEKIEREQAVRDKERAEALSRAKSAFLASMSHEIRTPINSIMGMNDLVLQTELNEDQSRNLSVVREASDHLLGIINDILDFSKIEAGKLELEHVDFDLHRTVQSALDVVRVQTEQKGLKLNVEIAPDVPQTVQGDPVRLRQVLLNLLTNGAKFTQKGSVSLKIIKTKADDTITFSVADTGIGIPKNKQRSVFEGFTQADESMTRQFGGTGLGLSISRQLVELMGGNIELNSMPGKGSTFRFTAVLAPGDPSRMQAEPEITPAEFDTAGITPLNVLVAEDNQNNILLMKSILERTSHSVQYVGNGLEALDALRTTSFDIVLMDLEMPEMSGLDAAHAVRSGQAGTNNTAVPIIALTAHALDEVKRRCVEAGMNGFITKPFKIEALLGALMPPDENRAEQPPTDDSPDTALDTLPIIDPRGIS